MLEQIFYGYLLGLGAAVPIGPINLEMMRRNLNYGRIYGIALGLGASCADITYLILISFGFISFLKNVILLRIVGVLGALLLLWFAYQCFKMPANAVNVESKENVANEEDSRRNSSANDEENFLNKQNSRKGSFFHQGKNRMPYWHTAEGFVLTLINPFTILFWCSISAHLSSSFSSFTVGAIFSAGLGVILGTLSWVLSFNFILGLIKHRISSNISRVLNISGGLILLIFASIGIYSQI